MHNKGSNTSRVILENSRTSPRDFDVIYKRYAPRVFAYFLRRVSSREVAEDLTQETFLRAFRHRHRFKEKGYPYSSYLFRVAHNLLVNYYRTHKPLSLEYIEHDPPDQPASVNRDSEYAWKAVQSLSPTERFVMEEKYKKGSSVKEIARHVGKSENAVKLILSRARKKLRSHPFIRGTK